MFLGLLKDFVFGWSSASSAELKVSTFGAALAAEVRNKKDS